MNASYNLESKSELCKRGTIVRIYVRALTHTFRYLMTSASVYYSAYILRGLG